MNREQLIRELRKYARKNNLKFDLETKQGKGSHYIVCVGDRRTTMQHDIDPHTARRIRKQLGIAE